MNNDFLEVADKQWEKNGLLIEKAILMIQDIKRGKTFFEEEYDDVLSGLLTTLMTDTPSGMFNSAFESMIEARLGATRHDALSSS